MKLSLRRRLLTVAALAAAACAGALYAVLPLARSSQDQRLERARDFAERVLDRTRDRGDRVRRDDAPRGPWGGGSRRSADATARRRGLRKVWSGRLDAAGRVPRDNAVPAEVRHAIERLAPGLPAGVTEVVDLEASEGEVGMAVSREATGELTFAAVMLVEPAEAVRWRMGVLVLAAATLLLVVASLHALVAIGRGTKTLSGSLDALATDLAAPVARPTVRELADVGDGISELAARLRRSREEETRLSSELAQQAQLATLGRVAAGVAHEVRNPLAAIKLRVDLLRLGAVSPAVAADLSDVASEVERLDRLVADLLVVTGRRIERRSCTDLGALVRARVDLLAPWAAERGVRLVCRGEGHAEVDTDSITRVLDNLLRNAIEASPADSDVDVEVTQHDRDVVIAVIDRGAGIPENDVERAFEPFFTTKPDGTGLGLALCRSIAAGHDGSLGYERVAGTTRFHLRLPSRTVG